MHLLLNFIGGMYSYKLKKIVSLFSLVSVSCPLSLTCIHIYLHTYSSLPFSSRAMRASLVGAGVQKIDR